MFCRWACEGGRYREGWVGDVDAEVKGAPPAGGGGGRWWYSGEGERL